MNRRASRVEFATERIAGSVLSMISFGMGVSRSADILEILFRQGRFVGRKRPSSRGCCLASAEDKDCDESRENGQCEAT